MTRYELNQAAAEEALPSDVLTHSPTRIPKGMEDVFSHTVFSDCHVSVSL